MQPGIDPTTQRPGPAAAPGSPEPPAARLLRAREFGERGLRFTDKVRLAYWNAFQHDCLNTAKAAAYSAIFALFPAIIVAAAAVTLLPGSAPLRYQLAFSFKHVLPESIAPLLDHYFTETQRSPESVTVLLGTLVVSLTGVAGVLSTLMEGFRRAYGYTEECWGKGIYGFLVRYVRSLLLGPFALAPLAAMSLLLIFGHLLLPLLHELLPLAMDNRLVALASALRWLVTSVIVVAETAIIYRYGVPVQPGWLAVLPGAVFSTITWFAATLGFGWYVTHLGNYSKTYGSLGAGVVLLLWLFLTAFTVLCGAELNAELERGSATNV